MVDGPEHGPPGVLSSVYELRSEEGEEEDEREEEGGRPRRGGGGGRGEHALIRGCEGS